MHMELRKGSRLTTGCGKSCRRRKHQHRKLKSTFFSTLLHIYLDPDYSADIDYRDSALRVDPASVEVHHLNSVRVNSIRFAVSRHRRKKLNSKFELDSRTMGGISI